MNSCNLSISNGTLRKIYDFHNNYCLTKARAERGEALVEVGAGRMVMAGGGGEMQGHVIFDYYPSNITLTKRYHKTTACNVGTAF